MGAGMGAGIGVGIAIGVSSGKKQAYGEFKQKLEEEGYTLHDATGKQVDFETVLPEPTQQPVPGMQLGIILGVSVGFGIIAMAIAAYFILA